jgi:hypothetical protein
MHATYGAKLGGFHPGIEERWERLHEVEAVSILL